MFEPLKITAYLQSGIACDVALPIDGILFGIAMKLEYGAPIVSAPLSQLGVEAIDLPLEKRNPGLLWYYAASFAQWSGPVVEYTDYWNKRIDQSLCYLVDFNGRRGRIETKSGRYKPYHMPVFCRHALYVNWYVVGDGEQIENILRFTTHIGKKPSQGDGAVLKWTVEPFHADWSERGPQGQLMRAIPDSDGVLMGFRPSYWERGNQTTCTYV
jgi:CRISPR type IV-associated protein Csf3